FCSVSNWVTLSPLWPARGTTAGRRMIDWACAGIAATRETSTAKTQEARRERMGGRGGGLRGGASVAFREPLQVAEEGPRRNTRGDGHFDLVYDRGADPVHRVDHARDGRQREAVDPHDATGRFDRERDRNPGARILAVQPQPDALAHHDRRVLAPGAGMGRNAADVNEGIAGRVAA